jgi:hypothetical protein
VKFTNEELTTTTAFDSNPCDMIHIVAVLRCTPWVCLSEDCRGVKTRYDLVVKHHSVHDLIAPFFERPVRQLGFVSVFLARHSQCNSASSQADHRAKRSSLRVVHDKNRCSSGAMSPKASSACRSLGLLEMPL